jgi:peptide-methionine (R)-S-oxide reductase
MRTVLAAALALTPAALAAAGPAAPRLPKTVKIWSEEAKAFAEVPTIQLSDAEWKARLDPFVYKITREAGTERAFTGALDKEHRHGIYRCAACGTDLFRSEHKFDSGTGWPSFHSPIAKENVATHSDRSWVMERTEVRCPRCGAHLGHVFDDGPPPTGKRYCINSAALTFQPR